jgi:lysozyme
VTAREVPACALAIIQRFEGLHDGDKRTPHLLEPQPCPAGIYTVGWGYALFERGRPVRDRETAYRIWRTHWPRGFTRAEADDLLRLVAQDVCDRVVRLLPGVALNQNELGALVSLAYNIGVGEVGGGDDFADSTVRHRLVIDRRQEAADAFRLWNKVDRRVVQGLVNRREAERTLFLTPVRAAA